ncbi:hypothetical protein RYZ26_00885 [Terasakiella sp. A23]|uniref:hypothetical protein n=1 Tax=Terasakiella sp. FCG-A23 TaxID=3080561 RepID=UPI002955B269|nr:hypothetical protein [Terasakiella sp. A23]MDV7338130.1 hypothetical protein [Terasakiella sp. A23]
MSDGRPALRFKTPVPLNVLEDFLERECGSGWDLKLEGIAEDLGQKVVLVSFTDANDLAKFKAGYSALKKQHGG